MDLTVLRHNFVGQISLSLTRLLTLTLDEFLTLTLGEFLTQILGEFLILICIIQMYYPNLPN